jgi:mono/diheme cytochrome c family protein
VNGAPALGFARMTEQPRYDPYEGSAFFADGRSMRPLPPGTVSREAPEWDTLLVTDSVADRMVAAASAPDRVTRGTSRFGIYCAVCHGQRADGESVVAHNMVGRRPGSLLTPPVAALTTAQLYGVVTRGLGRMPSYAADLSVADRWAVIAYLRVLQRDASHDTTSARETGPR